MRHQERAKMLAQIHAPALMGFGNAEVPHVVMPLHQDETIFIAERVFHMGTKQMASALIEEYIHLKHGYHDMTRELQTFLFDKIVSLGEEINGEPL